MRALRLLPLTFVIGIDGFAMFAPYVILLLTVAWAVEWFRTQPQSQPVALPA